MPYSSAALDQVSETLIRNLPLGRCLDIGPGAGKYGKLVRSIHPSAHTMAIEIDAEYIDRFELRAVYDEVLCGPASLLFDGDLDIAYDLVIIGDCLEHMRKSEGVDLLNFLAYRSKYIFVVYPVRWIQGSWGGHRSEAHISVWSESDFAWLDNVTVRSAELVAVAMNGFQQVEGVDSPVGEILADFTAPGAAGG
jgi:hypothetical protein